MAKELANEVGLSYTKEKGFAKGVNVRSLPIEGVTQGAFIQIGQWKGKANSIIAPLDDKKFYLGNEHGEDILSTLCQHHVHHGKRAALCCPREKGDR